MVRLRLRRVGRKKQASFRLVAADARSPRDGRFIEILGHYNPRTDPPTVLFKEERVLDCLQRQLEEVLRQGHGLSRSEAAPDRGRRGRAGLKLWFP